MNPVIASVTGLFLSALVIASAHAGPAKPESKPGITNAKKVMVAKLRQDAKMRTDKKQAIAAKHQRVAKKATAQ